MEVIVAKSAGFCFGVKKAVDTVYDLIEKGVSNIYTYGPIIHNENVVSDLESKGVKIIENLDDAKKVPKGTVVIRSHGVSREEYETIKACGHDVIDATCPFVKKIHNAVSAASEEGRHIVIIGDEKHPEVCGIKGWANGPVSIIKTEDEANSFSVDEDEKIFIVAQTTFNYKKFEYLVEKISKKRYDISCLNTICNATHVRQEEAMQIAKNVDAMIVIGGKHSSNTQKLFEICKSQCENTYYIQELVDLDLNDLKSIGSVGITAGASTPNNIIEEVQTHVRSKF